MTDLADLRDAMREFTTERDWDRFHDPKSLVLALVGEVGELAELMQWIPAESARERLAQQPLSERIAAELADVLIYLVRLSDVVGCDLSSAAQAKLAAARLRFPADKVRGVAPEKG